MTESASTLPQDGNLGITLATWTFLLHQADHPPDDPAVRAACEKIQNAGEDQDLDALGRDLMAAIRQVLGEDRPAFERVAEVLRSWYGSDRIRTDLGEPESRGDRARGIRRYQFGNPRPWIALVIDRFPDGTVGEHWVMVEETTDVVKVMDPYPWDDVDEQYTLPLVDFMVRWELAGCHSLCFA